MFISSKIDASETTVFISDTDSPTLPSGFVNKRIIGNFSTEDITTNILMSSVVSITTNAKIMLYTYNTPMANVVGTVVDLIGSHQTLFSGETSDHTSVFALSNYNLVILVNTITGSGIATITGTSLDDITKVPTTSDTEVITIDTSSF